MKDTMTSEGLHGKPYAENWHTRLDEREGKPVTPRRGSLHYGFIGKILVGCTMLLCSFFASAED